MAMPNGCPKDVSVKGTQFSPDPGEEILMNRHILIYQAAQDGVRMEPENPHRKSFSLRLRSSSAPENAIVCSLGTSSPPASERFRHLQHSAMAVQPRRIRGAVLLGLCLCSIWTFSAQQAFTKTEVIEETDVSTGVKLVAEHPLLFSFLSMALCGALCCTENSATPRQGNAEDRADYNSFLMIQNILCFASGIVNALTIIDMGMTVSHQSGNTSHTGRLIMNGGAKFGHLLASFCFGSFFAGFSKSDCEAIYSGRYSPNLLAATIAVVLGCTVHYCKEHGGAGNDNTSECLLLFAFSQGIQNGITRRCLSLPICTTHFTGYLTDVGTGFGAWARATMNGEKPPTLLKVLLFFAGTLFFLLGGVAAKELHGPYNMQGALVAAGLMGAISAGLVPVVKVKKTSP
ncbi:unnamed protein product [Durusdinium trenchii]|uniref:Uncharacterized protein n=2 Tax=Durusdinium trenchii TaxID=1381693 RepID=A0ABP0NGZ8_9DINO